MIVRHYNRNGVKRVRKMHPDAELDMRLAATPHPEREPSLRGIGIISAPTVKVSRPTPTRRNDAYIAKNGARIATRDAGYLEFAKDVQRGRPRAGTCYSIIPDVEVTTTSHTVDENGVWHKSTHTAKMTLRTEFTPARKRRKHGKRTQRVIETRADSDKALAARVIGADMSLVTGDA